MVYSSYDSAYSIDARACAAKDSISNLRSIGVTKYSNTARDLQSPAHFMSDNGIPSLHKNVAPLLRSECSPTFVGSKPMDCAIDFSAFNTSLYSNKVEPDIDGFRNSGVSLLEINTSVLLAVQLRKVESSE